MTTKETKASLPLWFRGLIMNVCLLMRAPMERAQMDMPGAEALLNMH